jgi:hypothetical protein
LLVIFVEGVTHSGMKERDRIQMFLFWHLTCMNSEHYHETIFPSTLNAEEEMKR